MVTTEEVPKITLSINLIKPEWVEGIRFISNAQRLESHRVHVGRLEIGTLYVKRPRGRVPSWAKFFEGVISPDLLGRSSSTAAVLVVPIDDRTFVLTFGQGGRFLLDSDSIEERFGLLVALNSIGADKIRSIDKRTFDAIANHARVQSSQEAAPQEFGIDVERDLVNAVTGTPEDSEMGSRLTGADTLRAAIHLSIEELPEYLGRVYAKYRSRRYQQNFKWIDLIAEVKEKTLIGNLDTKLVEIIQEESFEKCWMAVPVIVEWANIDGFRYGFRRSNPKYYDIHLPEFINEIVGEDDVSLDFLKNKRVYCIGNDDMSIDEWPAYKCIYSELDYRGQSYLLSAGKWYRVARDFVQEVNESFNQMPRYANQLPEYNDENEAAYNTRVARESNNSLALMDRNLIQYGSGYNKLEFCDLYDTQKHIIHVKRYGGSSLFSHLFSQGAVSGELFALEEAFRSLVNQKLPETHRINNVTRRPSQDEYQIVFAVVSDSDGLDLTIPFFSRLNLRAAARRLRGYGYHVSIAKISVNNRCSLNRRYDAD